MRDNQPGNSTGLFILVPALLLCCLGPVLLTSASVGSLSLLSGYGAFASIGIAALTALAAILFVGQRKRDQ